MWEMSICVCNRTVKKVSHYQVQRADVFVDNLSEHTEVLTEPLWRDQTQSKAAHKQQLCTYTSPLLLPRLALHVPPVVFVCQQPPLHTHIHTHQHSWHRGTQAVKIKLSGSKHLHNFMAKTAGKGRGGMKEEKGRNETEGGVICGHQ